MIDTVRTVQSLREKLAIWRQAGKTIALVPTMGALHDGHLDLVRAAKSKADKVVASLFVNPTQFAAHEDLDRYPRTEARDSELLAQTGCDLLYAPTKDVMYPEGFATTVALSGVTAPLEGSFRPHFFAGVATIVAKLFIQVDPDFAFFGEKDWQQLQVVKKMACDLDLRVQVLGVETRRETDGLAMSSRNAYLSPDQRKIAPALKAALDDICDAIASDNISASAAESEAAVRLVANGFASVDYLAACHAHTLEPWHKGDPLRVLGAAWLGTTRLIDNRGP
jgi:pantoate--beta-alanine ligase